MESFSEYIKNLQNQVNDNTKMIFKQQKIIEEYKKSLDDQSSLFKIQNQILNKLLDRVKLIQNQLNTENTNVNDSILDIMKKLDEK